MKKLATLAVLVLGGFTVVAASPSSGFAQSDPSQFVTLTSSGASTGPCAVSQLVVDSMVNPADGALVPFVIPPRKLLVLTGGTWSVGPPFSPPLDPNSAVNLQVFLTSDGSPETGIILGPSVLASGKGVAAGAFTLQPGIVIKPGASMCVNFRHDNTQLAFLGFRLHGYLAQDK